MRIKDIDIKRIDWTRRTSDLSESLGIATDRVSALRRIHAPHTLRARSPKAVQVVLERELGERLIAKAAEQGMNPAVWLAGKVGVLV